MSKKPSRVASKANPAKAILSAASSGYGQLVSDKCHAARA
jgi:hypothetical protein